MHAATEDGHVLAHRARRATPRGCCPLCGGRRVSDAQTLPVVSRAALGSPAIDRSAYAGLARRARLLSWLSLAWMTVEGTVAIIAGIVAGSVALIGFGLRRASLRASRASVFTRSPGRWGTSPGATTWQSIPAAVRWR